MKQDIPGSPLGKIMHFWEPHGTAGFLMTVSLSALLDLGPIFIPWKVVKQEAVVSSTFSHAREESLSCPSSKGYLQVQRLNKSNNNTNNNS